MAVTTPYRTTPQLGPQLDEVFVGLPYWDSQLGVGFTVTPSPSYKLGNRESGNDGHVYIWVKNGDTPLTASARVNITESTWTAAANATGTHMAPAVAVPANAYFHARQFTL